MARKKTTKSTAKSKKSLKSMSQTHGKVETKKATTLDQVWGDTGHTKYGTMDIDKYEAELRSFPKVDLQAHATKIGLIPIDNRETLTSRLIKEFKKHVASYNTPDVKRGQDVRESQVSEEVVKILRDGR